MQRIHLLFLLCVWLILPLNKIRAESMSAPVKKGTSLLSKATRPAINVICKITDDLRWVPLIFALVEFIAKRADYDPFNSVWIRLWVGALVVHAVCESI